MHFSKPMNCISRENPNINYGLGFIMMCQFRLLLGKKCIVLVSDMINKEGYEYV